MTAWTIARDGVWMLLRDGRCQASSPRPEALRSAVEARYHARDIDGPTRLRLIRSLEAAQ